VSGDRDVVMRRFGIVMIALVALVLVVACTNLANLVLARGTTRQHELAVRRAIGASRWRLVREQCTESLLIAILGAGAAWLVFNALSTALDVDLPIAGQLLISFTPVLDPAALVIALGALGLSLVVFGLEPAFQLTRERALRDGLAVSSGNVGVPKAKRQRSLVRWQVAISTGFFILAALSVKYAVAEARHDSGVDLDRLAVATMNFWRQQWDGERARTALQRVLEEIEKDSAVESAAVSTGVPFGSTGTAIYFMSTPDKPIVSKGDFRWGPGIAATPRIFQTLGIRIVRGRGFDDRDDASAAPVAVISERTAIDLFGTTDAVGRPMIIKPRAAAAENPSVARRLALPSRATPAQTSDATRAVTIVGIASDTDVVQLFGDPGDIVYLPLAQEDDAMPFAIALARSHDDPSAGVRALRSAIGRANPDLAIESLGTGLGTLGGPTVILRAATGFALALGALTLVLAMVGLFGVQSHGVAHRTREIGVRMSFGATAAHIRALVLREGYRPVLQGIALGIFIGFVGRGLARAFLWEKIELVDAWMLLAVPVPMILAAFFACYWPAHRASRVDPNVALRHL
jgi:predicted permease